MEQLRLHWSRTRVLKTLVATALTAWALAPVLGAEAVPLQNQPFPDSYEYADGAWQLAHGNGYVTFVNEHTGRFGTVARPPRYPFGTSVALAPFAAAFSGFPHGVQIGARIFSALYVLIIVIAAWRLGGPLAAAIAALMVGLSPFAQTTAGLILSDPLAALLSVAILIALSFRKLASDVLTGVLSGALICVRLLGVIALPAALLAVRNRRSAIVILVSSLPLVAALGLYQWLTFGSPLRTGYSYWLPGLHEFDLSFFAGHTTVTEGPFVIADKLHGDLFSFVCPCGLGGSMSALRNIVFYPSVLAGLFWVFAPPLTGVVGLLQMLRERQTPAARYALTTLVLNTGIVLFYFDQAARFVAPAASLLLVYSAKGLAELAGWAVRTVPRRRPQRVSDEGFAAA
ncbi:MAG: hypothetical protein ACYDHH_01470 [Solirubrobacteraceae bacterium]